MKQVKPCPFECNANDCKDCGAYTYSHHTPTNEEWFCGLSTEEKAYHLADICAWAMEEFRCGKTEKANTGYWQKWLKQPHTERG